MKIAPEKLRLLGRRILVRKYERPEKVGSIYLNPAWTTDNSRALWEVVKSSEGADEHLGMELQPDWILVTPPHRGVHVADVELPNRTPAFVVDAAEVAQVKMWDASEERENAKG